MSRNNELAAVGILIGLGLFGTWAPGRPDWTMPQEIQPIKAPFPMPDIQRPVFPERDFLITDYGALEGGTVKAAQAISRGRGLQQSRSRRR